MKNLLKFKDLFLKQNCSLHFITLSGCLIAYGDMEKKEKIVGLVFINHTKKQKQIFLAKDRKPKILNYSYLRTSRGTNPCLFKISFFPVFFFILFLCECRI